jgi:hypothetical protein
MTIDRSKRKIIAKTERVLEAINGRPTQDKGEKVDLTSIAKTLSERREKILSEGDGGK